MTENTRREAKLVALAVILGMLLVPASARAGSYHVYSCRMPDGAAAPADGWAGTKTGTFVFVEDGCTKPGGALLAGLGDQAARTANTDQATWAFTAPAGERISAATLWRAGDADGGAAVNATYQIWFAGPNNVNNPSNAFGECVAGVTCPSGVGTRAEPLSAENKLSVPAQNLGSQLFMNATCSGESGFKCKQNQGDENGFAAVVYLYAADLTLEQSAGPGVSGVGGELATAPTVSGTSAVTFSASDPGSGVYEALVSVDGVLVQATPLDENGGRCRNVGQTTDGLPAFLYVQPCLASLAADVQLDTTRLANGTHHVVVSVTDAAGNSAPVIDRNVVVANSSLAGGPPPSTSPAPGTGTAPLPGAPNGTNASSPATLNAAWRGARGTRLLTPYGRTETITGSLSGVAGPISGAEIEEQATPASAGARTLTLPPVRTAADGSFAIRIPPGVSSRTITLSYRAHLGDATPAAARTLTLAVRAAVQLSITPRTASVGRRIRFSGRLLGGPVPATGKLLVLEARPANGSWIKFEVVRSDRRGRFHASYRFRFPGPATYRFRVLAEAEGDYPYATGTSNTVLVRER